MGILIGWNERYTKWWEKECQDKYRRLQEPERKLKAAHPFKESLCLQVGNTARQRWKIWITTSGSRSTTTDYFKMWSIFKTLHSVIAFNELNHSLWRQLHVWLLNHIVGESPIKFQNICNKQLRLFQYAVFRPVWFLITCQVVMFVLNSPQHQSLMVVHHQPIWGWISKQPGLCSSLRIYRLEPSALAETAAEV